MNLSHKTIPDILSELFKNEIFYKLIIFESLDNEKFMNFIKRFKFTDETKKTDYNIIELHGIYIKIVLDATQIESYFTAEEKIKIDAFNVTNKPRYTKLTGDDKLDTNDYVFHILELDYYRKNEKFKDYIEDEEEEVLNVAFFKNIVLIINKNSQTPYENLLDNTIQNLKIKQNKDVLTFLKLRNDQDEDGEYNDRFKIFLNKKPSKLALYYKNDNVPFYKLNGKKYELIHDLKDKDNNDIAFNDYKYKYLFGPFTKIFIPIQPNDEIAQNMETIKTSLEHGKDVFVIGYGASGAGKTSTLVYLKTEDKTENGIVINICNQLSDIFEEIQLSSIELYEQNGTEQAEVVRSRTNKDTYDFIFDKEKNEFLSKEKIIHQNKHGTKNIKDFTEKTPIGDVIIHMIDIDRLIFGTTNNPRSSRSHALIFLKLKYKISQSKDVYLIIGDFAGVENKFECEKPEVIKRFSEIHVTRREGRGTKKIYAYQATGGKSRKNKNKIKGGMLLQENSQPQSEGQTQPQSQEKSKAFDIPTINEIIDTTQPYIYDFNKPEYRPQWNLDKQLFINVFIIIKTSTNDFQNLQENTFNYLTTQLTAFKNAGSIEAARIAHEAKVNKNIKDILGIITEFVTGIKFKEEFKPVNKPTLIDLLNNTFSRIETIIKPYDKAVTEHIDAYIEKIKSTYNINVSIAQTGQSPLIPLITKSFEDIKDISLFDKIQTLYNDNSLILFFLNKNCKSSVWKNIFGVDDNTFKKLMFIFYVLPAFIEANPLVGQVSKVNIFEGIGDTDRAQEIINKFKELFINSEKNKTSLTKECTLRLNEGIFINKSLQDLRTIIKDIISEKNKGIVIPNFIGDCFDKYFKNDYFKSSKSTTLNISSVIINEIINEIFVPNETQEKTQQEKEKETFKKDFLNNLIISIFCVFNISRGANNPPPTHYIDINKLKYIFKIDKKNQQITKNLIDEINNVRKLITTLGIDFSDSPEYNNLTYINNTLIIAPVPKKTKFLGYIQSFNNFIDNFNAPSAVGTLDFLDSLAKYNTIDNICRIDSDFRHGSELDNPSNEQVDTKIKNIFQMNNMIELYQENNHNENNFNSLIKKEQENINKSERIKRLQQRKIAAKSEETTPEPEPEPKSEPKSEPKPNAAKSEETAPEPEPNAGTPETKQEPNTGTPESKPEPKPKQEPKPNAGTQELKPNAGTPESKPEPEPKSEPKSEPKPELPKIAQTTDQLIEIAEKYNDAALNACLTLGNRYKDQPENLNQAIEYYEKAALSHTIAYTYLSTLYLKQIKNMQDPERISAIHYKLGLIYEFGKGVEQNYKTAKYHYETASNSDSNVAAIRRLGVVLMKMGEYDNAQTKLTEAYQKDDNGVILYIVQLFELMKQKIMNQNSQNPEIVALNKSIKELLEYGQSNSILDIILLISNSREENFDTIKKKFIELIKLYTSEDIDEIIENAKNDESSQFILGMIYDEGLIEQKKDEYKAKYWYKKSYESGYSPAEFILSEQKN